MAHLPDILSKFPADSGMSITYICGLLDISDETWRNWRCGAHVPTRVKAQHLATLIGRPELVDLCEQDRAELAKHRRDHRSVARSDHPTPRTMIIQAPTTGDGGRA